MRWPFGGKFLFQYRSLATMGLAGAGDWRINTVCPSLARWSPCSLAIDFRISFSIHTRKLPLVAGPKVTIFGGPVAQDGEFEAAELSQAPRSQCRGRAWRRAPSSASSNGGGKACRPRCWSPTTGNGIFWSSCHRKLAGLSMAAIDREYRNPIPATRG
jgi:hypothetical protein